jgi:regulatory protein YycI of two-component signal transduction system YycFG
LVIAAFCNPIGMENIGYKYYIVFCCLLAVFLAVTYFDDPRAVVDTQATEKQMNKNLYEEKIEERIERA